MAIEIGQDQPKRGRPGRQQNQQHSLWGVGHRRQRIGGEDGQRLHLRDALILLERGRDRRADQHAPDHAKRATRPDNVLADLKMAALALEAGLLGGSAG